MERRTVLGLVAGASVAGLAGCSDGATGDGGTGDGDAQSGDGDGSDGGGAENEVLVGPNNSQRFDPETITVSAGATVTWRFESPGHNVSCNPDHHPDASLPDDAEPFASYEGDDTYGTLDVGATFEHTFEVAGDYEYVCVPHTATGMVGTVRVEE